MNFYQIVFLFFAYSFLGWVGEVLFTAVVHHKYQDRGVLNGPLCLLYGVGGLVITFALGDIREAGSSCLYSAPSMPRSLSGSAGTFWSTRPIPGGGITAPCRSIWTAMSASARR